jgi:hypothetical protein
VQTRPTCLIALCALAAVSLLPACVRYQPQFASVEASVAGVPATPLGALPFEAAVRLLVARNPDLAATRAAIAAVNVSPGPAPLGGTTQFEDGRMTETILRTDVLSLLGLGPRGARIALARALRDERVRAHHERARALVADLAEAYAIERVLRDLPDPDVDLDLDVAAYERAGLAPEAVLAAARSLRAEGGAEARVVASRLQDARRAVARLVGAGPGSSVEPAGVEPGWPAPAEVERNRLLLTRGDLQRLQAAWLVADRRYRYEVARQMPNLVVGLGANVDLEFPMQVVQVELPLDAPAEARAAERARRVAFHELEAGVLDALHDAASARLDLEAAVARREAAVERRAASRHLLRARLAQLETDPEALGDAVLVGGRVVDAARQFREAAVDEARARVRAARASGWPAPDTLGGTP